MKTTLPVVYTCIFAVMFFPALIHAQGTYQIWGTANGGKDNTGIIFSTGHSGDHFHKRFDFTKALPGGSPTADLVEYKGKFYGVTNDGKSNNTGVIFEWDAVANVYTKKFDFEQPDGRIPRGSLTLLGDKFYGVTSEGGANNAGVIFEWDAVTNVYTKKIDLNLTDGSSPVGDLIFTAGKFYGLTALGGINDQGVIFEWDPESNVYTKKMDFSANGINGRAPVSGLKLRNGKLYGMMLYGGANDLGVIFEWDPVTNIYTKKIDFNGQNGSYPQGSLTLYGDKFYGTATEGGLHDAGVIFIWDPSTNTYTKKIDLTISSGRYPKGALTRRGTSFYGMTQVGGLNDAGVIFEWDAVTNVYRKKVDLSTTLGSNPFGGLTILGNKFYGMTWRGGSNNTGVIFEWNSATNIYTKKIQFGYSDGGFPNSGLTRYNGKLYGFTATGGNHNAGVLYEWDPVKNLYTKKIDLGPDDILGLNGDLIPFNGKYYGVGNGGQHGAGVLFEWDPASNTCTKKVDFYEVDDRYPVDLKLLNGKFYGTTVYGNGAGTLFQWDPISNVYTKQVELVYTEHGISLEGSNFQSLALKDGKFYGKTSTGGIYDKGVFFEYDPVTNVYTKKMDAEALTGGINDEPPFVLFDNKFYGTISSGGSYGFGFIFEWDPVTNVYTRKFDFNASGGTYPASGLLLSGRKFYGATNEGGNYDKGVIFEWDPVSNVYTKKKDFDSISGSYSGLNINLLLAPAPVAEGLKGNCTALPAITIDNSNNNIWVPITDTLGEAVAEIKANGNNLGKVTASVFINDAAVREDNAHRLYLDRSITLTPEVQPTSPVDIRLYIKNGEYTALKNASNSMGQPSGIDSISQVSVFRNYDDCSQSTQSALAPVISTVDEWEGDYVFLASVDSLSSFYFAGKAAPSTAPAVQITTPANNATYIAPASFYLKAEASDADGSISKVEFYNGATLLRRETVFPYAFTWHNVPAGNYTLTAKATDNSGLVTTSAEVYISVVSNTAPTISITDPANEQTFLKGGTVHLKAAAADADGSIAKVEFYNGSVLLATERKLPYTFDWKPQLGNYVITARAFDEHGAVTTSSPVHISVVPNKAPSVSIIEPANGTNFTAPATVSLKAAAQDPDGRITKVEFYNGITLLALERKLPYTFNWQNVPEGSYTITARATDNWGTVTTSAPVQVLVAKGAGCTSVTRPTFGFNFNGARVANINNGFVDPSESASITVCDGGKYTTSAHFNSSSHNLYNIAYASVGSTLLFNGGPVSKIVITAAQLSATAGNYTITLAEPDIAGTLIQTITPFTDLDNNGMLNAGDCAGDPIIFTYTALPCAGNKTVVAGRKASLDNTAGPPLASLNLAPNPASNILNIYTKGFQNNRPTVISVISASGAVMKVKQVSSSLQTMQLDVSSLASGIYMLKIMNGGRVIYKKFVKG